MSFITKRNQYEKTTFGVIVGNRDVFPDLNYSNFFSDNYVNYILMNV